MPNSLSPRPYRVLVISPHFPPVNAPDLHRIRQALPHLAAHNWVAEILTVHPDDVENEKDPLLAKSLPQDLIIHRVRAIPAYLTRYLGFGGLAYRAYHSLKRKGNRLLADGSFDLVFFSTSIFGVLTLGPYWKKRYAIPYVVDFQDPWVYERGELDLKTVPGGRWKYALTNELARWHEGRVIREAAHVITVSSRYITSFLRRYPELPESHYTEMTFGGAPSDYEFLENSSIRQTQFISGKTMNWVYAGRGGPDLSFSLKALFLALKQAVQNYLMEDKSLHLHFFGTEYRSATMAKKTIEPLARECGVAHLVTEIPYRLPYFTTLACLRQADALIIPGSQTSSYSASKIYPYILAHRPLLAVFREESNVVRILKETQASVLVPFQEKSSQEEISKVIYENWFLNRSFLNKPKTNWNAFSKYTSFHLTGVLAGIFNQSIRATS